MDQGCFLRAHRLFDKIFLCQSSQVHLGVCLSRPVFEFYHKDLFPWGLEKIRRLVQRVTFGWYIDRQEELLGQLRLIRLLEMPV